jgi:hypothetical protein
MPTHIRLIEQFKTEPIEQHYMSGKSKPTNSNNKNGRFMGNCHNCHTYGHRIAECAKMAQDNSVRHNSSTYQASKYGQSPMKSVGTMNSSYSSNNNSRNYQGSYPRGNTNNFNRPTNGFGRVNFNSNNNSQATNMNTTFSNQPMFNSTFNYTVTRDQNSEEILG